MIFVRGRATILFLCLVMGANDVVFFDVNYNLSKD